MAAPLGRCCCRALVQNKRAYFYRTFSSSPAVLQPTQASHHSDSQRIAIPKRKQRHATSILEAIASTVQKDFDAPHYKYLDDPFLIPASSLEKRAYSLSRASGQRAADYALKMYPDGFMHNPATPSIADFMPPLSYAYSEDTVAGLEERIEQKQPLQAFQSHQALKEAGVAVPVESMIRLLELLAFYNSEDPPPEQLPDEKFFYQESAQDSAKAIRNTWKKTGPAEQIYREMPEKTTEARLALLKGRSKYFEIDAAWDLFMEMKAQDAPMSVEAFNAIISLVPFLRDQSETRWELILELFRDMTSRQVAPNLATFNSALYAVSRNFRFRRSRHNALQLIQEMKNTGIEPSLSSWYYVIRTVYGNDDVTSNLLEQIVDYLKGKELVANEAADYEFFATAMSKCYANLKDLDLAYKIDDLLNTDNNFSLLGGGFKQGLYHSFFLRTLCMFEQIDKVMEVYERITPHVYTPTFSAYDELFRAIELNEGYRYLPHIWSDLVLFDYVRRTDLIEQLLTIMGKKKQDDQLQGIFLQICQIIHEKFEEEKLTRRLRPFQLTGTMIGDLVQISINGGNFEGARNFFNIYDNNKFNIERFPSEDSLVSLAKACIENKDADLALKCLQLMADTAYPKVDQVAADITKGFALTEDQKNFIDDLL